MLPLILRRPAASVNSFAGFRNDLVAIVVEPVDQGAYRRIFLILDQRRVVVCAK